MKKLIMFFATIFIMVASVSCSDSPSEAFVRQICHEQGISDSDIKSIKSEPSDSLANPYIIGNNLGFVAYGVECFCKGELTADQVEKRFDETFALHDSVKYSWYVDVKPNDSISCRKVEKVTITFNSRQTKKIRVVFDNTNTPVMTEKQVGEMLDEDFESLMDLYKTYLHCLYN